MLENQQVVTLGGGTGHFTLLRGLNRARLTKDRKYDFALKTIPGTWDSGGSTGRLRVEEGTLPMGDYMQCLLALMEDEDQFQEAMVLLTDRTNGHPLRNTLASQAERIHHGVESGIEGLRRLFRVSSDIIPVSLIDLELCAQTKLGEIINGEANIGDWRMGTTPNRYPDEIAKIYFNPRAVPNPRALSAIQEANLRILAPGSPYTSIFAHFQVPGVADAFCEPNARRVAVLNIMTSQGEDRHLGKASYWLETLAKFTMRKDPIDYLVVNDNDITDEIRSVYQLEGQEPVEVDDEECMKIMPALKIVRGKLLNYDKISHLLRHNPTVLAQTILDL